MTETKSTPVETKSSSKSFEIKPFSTTEAKKAKDVSQKKKIKENLLRELALAYKNAESGINEYTCGKLKQIFSNIENNYTKITLRHGPITFYKGIVETQIIYPAPKGKKKSETCLKIEKNDDYSSKKSVLKSIQELVDDEKWFDAQYENYLIEKKRADAKAKKTREATKKEKVRSKAKAKVKDAE